MKSIFKKIAFVLALAMVVTMLPARAVSAAESDGPDMYKSLLLYLDSGNGEGADITGTYKSERYASVWGWREAGYTSVDFESADTSIATVNSKGKVTAVKVGTTTVTATFTADDMETVTKECRVTVKRNAAKVGLGSASAKQVEDGTIKVGDKVQLTAVRKDADGKTEWNKTMKEYTTDSVRFSSSNEEIFKVTKTTGMLTAVGAGEATLKVWTVQSEGKDPVTGEYPEVVSKEYKVVVSENKIDVQQTAWNAFSITFPDADAAAAAVAATLPSLSQADAHVSEDKTVVKVYEVLQAATDNKAAVEQEIFIKNIASSGNVVTVTVFNEEFKQETTYNVRYQDFEESFVTCKNIAVDFDVTNWVVADTRTEYALEKNFGYTLYATGKKGQLVDISGCEAYGKGDWKQYVTLEDQATEYNSNYVFSGVPGNYSIWFYTMDSAFTVTLKATFEDWFVVDGNTAKTFQKPVYVTPGDTSIVTGSLQEWGIVKGANAYDNKQLAVGDEGYRLAVKASIKEYGADKSVETNPGDLENDKFTFVSSNDDKISVNEKTGEIYPPKSAVDNVLVHVFYDEKYVGSCNVTVTAKRFFSTLSSDASVIKLAYGQNLVENKTVKVFTNDQLSAHYNGNGEGTVKLSIALADSNYDGWLTVNNVDVTKDIPVEVIVGSSTEAFNFQVTNKAASTAKTIRVIVTGVYESNDNKVRIEKKTSFNITVKNTSGATYADRRSYSLEVNPSTMDEILYKRGDEGNTTLANKTVTLSAYALDKEGFKIAKLDLGGKIKNLSSGASLGENDAAILIKKGNDTYLDTNAANVLGFTTDASGNVVFTTVAVDAATVSGGAATVSGGAVKKIATGNYSVNLFIGNQSSKATYKVGTVISVIDTQDLPTFRWVSNVVDDGTAIDIAKAALDLFFDADRNWDAENVDGDIIDADVVRNGNRATIKSVTYRWVLKDGNYFDFVVDINRTVSLIQ